jgi:recombination protein RecR
MAGYIAPIERLIEQYRKLPGVGAKTAARYAFATLNLTDEEIAAFTDALLGAKRDVHRCPICFALSANADMCDICADTSRDSSTVCVVENPKDVMVMEKIRGYRGVYHVLGGSLSPLDNVTASDLTIKELLGRVNSGEVKEVILATNPTPSGDTTAQYIARLLKDTQDVHISRLAYGIPVGADIEYADEVTLYRAMEGRRNI